MAKKFDPYDELGLDRGATPDDVHKAYRRASKKAHPDSKGGSPERFALVKMARDVLMSDKRRKKYDQTGSIDDADGEPNNIDANAREVIAEILNAIISSDPVDPVTQQPIDILQTDLAAILRDNVKNNYHEYLKRLEDAKKRLKRAQKMKKRFKKKRGKGFDFIARMLDGRIEFETQRMAREEEKVEIMMRAMEIAADYVFEAESAPAAIAVVTAGTATFFR